MTTDKFAAAVDAKGLKTFAVIDHAAGAESIGEALRPTTLFIFGSPKAGTPLMQEAQTMGHFLPLRVLIFKDADGVVKIATPHVAHHAHGHGVDGQAMRLEKIEATLAELAATAAN